MLVEKQEGALRIAAVDAAGMRQGLRRGMSLADARALTPQLLVEEIDRHADHAYLAAAAAASEMFTPMLAPDGADGLMLDITGCAHLFGGEAGLGRQACRRLAGLGLTTRAAIAGTPEAARAAARFGRPGIVPPGGEAEAGRALPVAALEAGPEVTIALQRAGLRTLGDLDDRPAAMLAARFGEAQIRRLARILGREDIRITPLRPPPDFLAEKHFPEPRTALEPLLAVFRTLAGDLAGLLERAGRGGRAFEASFFRADGAVRRLVIETAEPTRAPETVLRLLALRIEALADPIDPGFGFDAVRLAVTRSETMEARQPGLAGAGQPAEAGSMADLVGRLVARFGREAVLAFLARESHDPGRAGTVVPLLAAATAAPRPVPEPGEPPARPLTLLDPAEPVEALAEVPDGPPLRFRWRRVLHEIARAEGPERIAPEWWRAGEAWPATRDYYRLEDQAGRRFWLFREGGYGEEGAPPRWFVHGLFA